MMRWIIDSSLRLRHLVVIIAVVLLVASVGWINNMPVDVYPELNPPMVEIQTEALGLSAEEVEALITVPLEADLLNGVAWLDRIYSESVTSLSSILLVFEPGTDPIRARQMVQERLTQAHALPNVSKPPVMLQPLSATSRVMMVGISSQELSMIEMGVLARWKIKPRLMGVPGVANVAVWGQRERQLQVLVDPEELQAKGVTLQQVIATTGEALWVSPLSYLESSTPGTAGWIDTPNQRLGIRHLLPISSAEELARVAVKGNNSLLLGDVARVVEDHQPLIGDAQLQSGPGMVLVVEKFPGVNTLEVTRGVEAALQAMQPGLTGMQIDTNVFRPATFIELAIDNLGLALMVGGVLVALILAAFFFNWRTTLIALIVIPLSLTAAALVLFMRGATFNMLLLAGLVMAIGVIIDDAVVDIDNVARRLRQAQGAGGAPSLSLFKAAMLEMRGPLGYATLILVLVIAPIFFFQGILGALLQPVALSYLLAVGVSFLVALIVTPALSLALLEKMPRGKASPATRWLERSYSGLLDRGVRRPYRSMSIAAIVILLGIAVLPMLSTTALPDFKQTSLLIEWEAAPGTSRQEMNRIMAQASAELRALPGVINVGSHVGRAETGDQIVGINSGELWVSFDPAANHDATVAEIQAVIQGYPGFQQAVSTYAPERISEISAGTSDALTVRVFGHENDVLRAKAEEVRAAMAGINGLVNIRTDIRPDEPQVEIEVNLEAAQRYGVKPGDVRRTAATLLSGLQVGNLFEDQKVFDVVVWGVPEIRNSLSSVQNLLIDTPDGGLVRLAEVADVRIVPTPIVVRRDAVSRFVDVTAEVRGRSIAGVAAEIEQRLAAVTFPMEYHAEVIGGDTGRQAMLQRMAGVIAVILAGIYLLLQAAFSSWRMATAAFLALPMALTGGLLAALAFDGGTLSLGSFFGLIAVLGIAIRNVVQLVSHYQRLEDETGLPHGAELVLRGTGERAAPILTTALATALAVLPLVLFSARSGFALVSTIAIVILGGLVTSTLLTLYVLPALYLRWGARPAPSTAPGRVPALGEQAA